MDNRSNEKRLLLGIIFLILGGFILMGNLNILPSPLFWELKRMVWHWPVILIVIGLVHILLKEPKFHGAILILVGGLFMLPHWLPVPFNYREIIWPAIFIMIGLTIMIRGHRKRSDCCREEKMADQDMVDELAFFGGGDRIITSQNFKGGKITCIFGGLNLNFLRAKLSQKENMIDVFVVFGGMKIIVPEDWDVKIVVTSVFGGFADKRNISPSALENKKGELIIRGMAIFGGGEIKNF